MCQLHSQSLDHRPLPNCHITILHYNYSIERITEFTGHELELYRNQPFAALISFLQSLQTSVSTESAFLLK
jgi:hypothetical protein